MRASSEYRLGAEVHQVLLGEDDADHCSFSGGTEVEAQHANGVRFWQDVLPSTALYGDAEYGKDVFEWSARC